MQYGGLKALCCCIMVGVKNRNNESCLSRDCHSSMGKMLLGPHGQHSDIGNHLTEEESYS